mmetsp:Transcript_25597/g.44680  ORF Transcript_25597/g.44680 Transcript_25597/m.44680 type:complete len:166 (-) Transcript_25597:4356-4853(-)
MKALLPNRSLMPQPHFQRKALKLESEDLNQIRLVSKIKAKMRVFTSRNYAAEGLPELHRESLLSLKPLKIETLPFQTVTPEKPPKSDRRISRDMTLTPLKTLDAEYFPRHMKSITSLEVTSARNRFIPNSTPRLKRIPRLKLSPSLSGQFILKGTRSDALTIKNL